MENEVVITITNVTPALPLTIPHTYAIKISGTVLAMFQHNRCDGLATCLRKAAEAIEKKERKQ
jgi:hypothetical protein